MLAENLLLPYGLKFSSAQVFITCEKICHVRLTFFLANKILLLESRSILWPAQRVTGRDRIKFAVKKQKKKQKKNGSLLLELLEK